MDARSGPLIDEAFFHRDAVSLARALIGVRLLVDGAGGAIVETEAYGRDDPASHSFRGETARNASMFGAPGRLYVYRSYGLHWCLNVVAGEPGGAVLVRAIVPEAGLEAMQARRGDLPVRLLCAGPGRLCQALGVTGAHDGLSVLAPPFALTRAVDPHIDVQASVRIGISRGMDAPWRFTLAGSPFLSRKA